MQEAQEVMESEIRAIIKKSNLPKLFNRIHIEMIVNGLSAEQLADMLTRETTDGLNDKHNNEHTDGAVT